MKIGERVKQRRIELGMSVDELATKLKKNRATVYRYENNDIENLPTSILPTLAEALETTPAYLMGWTDSANETGKHEVYIDVDASTKEEAMHNAVKSMLIANGDVERALTITEEEAVELYELFGFKTFAVEDTETIAAHKDGENFTPDELEKIEEYKKLLVAARPKE